MKKLGTVWEKWAAMVVTLCDGAIELAKRYWEKRRT